MYVSAPGLRAQARAVPQLPAPTIALRLLLMSLLLRPSAQQQTQWHSLETVGRPNLVLEVAPVGEMAQVGVVHKQHNSGRALLALGGVEHLELPALANGRRVVLDRPTDHTVELGGGYPALTCFIHPHRGGQDVADPATGTGRGVHHRHPREEFEGAVDLAAPLF